MTWLYFIRFKHFLTSNSTLC